MVREGLAWEPVAVMGEAWAGETGPASAVAEKVPDRDPETIEPLRSHAALNLLEPSSMSSLYTHSLPPLFTILLRLLYSSVTIRRTILGGSRGPVARCIDPLDQERPDQTNVLSIPRSCRIEGLLLPFGDYRKLSLVCLPILRGRHGSAALERMPPLNTRKR